MINKQQLDRYLTSEPDTGFQDWCEAVYAKITDQIISDEDLDKHDQWINERLNEYTRGS